MSAPKSSPADAADGTAASVTPDASAVSAASIPGDVPDSRNIRDAGSHADTVLAELTVFLVDIVGDELLVTGEVTREARFTEDLALESIEFVALAERVQARYGEGVDLIGLLAEMDIDEIMDMSVGHLVDHIVAHTGTQDTVAGRAEGR